MSAAKSEVTTLLGRISEGDETAQDRLLDLIYPELKKIAVNRMRRERENHTLQATGLVHEAYLKLIGRQIAWKDRTHFLSVASQVMRRILVDYARNRLAQKRGGAVVVVSLDEARMPDKPGSHLVLDLDEALDRFAILEERAAKLVELRFFGGLTLEEAAGVIGVSTRTAKRDWKFAQAWLYGELADGAAGTGL